MRYFYTAAFKRAYRFLDSSRQKRIDQALLHLETLYAQSQRPFGLGLKSLKPGIWEVRAGLNDRILFRWTGDVVELQFDIQIETERSRIGNHPDALSRKKHISFEGY